MKLHDPKILLEFIARLQAVVIFLCKSGVKRMIRDSDFLSGEQQGHKPQGMSVPLSLPAREIRIANWCLLHYSKEK